MHTRSKVVAVVTLCSLFTLVWLPPAAASEGAREPAKPHAEMAIGADRIDWQPTRDYEQVVLTIAGPEGLWLRREFEAGQPASLSLFDKDGNQFPDGTYIYELRLAPRNTERPVLQAGSFAVRNGSFATPFEVAKPPKEVKSAQEPAMKKVTAAAQVIADDLVVQGDACIGNLCGSGDATGLLKLKDYTVGIVFEDVFDNFTYFRDWVLLANPGLGGPDHFSLRDVDAGTIPFAVWGDSPDYSLVVGSGGKIGIGTAIPAAPLHVNAGEVRFPPGSGGAGGFTHFNYSVDGKNYIRGTTVLVDIGGNVGIGTASPASVLDVKANAPTLAVDRLQNTSGSGYSGTEYLDNAGNVDLFFGVDNAASTTRLNSVNNNPIVILTNSTERMRVTSAGNIGIGTTGPSTKLHVSGAAGTTKALVEETSSTTTARELLELKNNGGTFVIVDDTSVAQRWSFGTFGSSFIINEQANAGVEFTLTNTGNLTIAGTLTQGSDRAMKEAIVPIQPEEVLAKLVSLPISTWSRKDEDPKVRHLGPMAQDFSAIFGLGEDDRHIAPLDMAGVSMASIQALHGKVAREMAEKDAEIAALRQRLVDLEELVSKLAAQ